MPTNTAGTTARQLSTQQVHYLRKRILGSAGNATYTIGTLPVGANVLRISMLTRVVMNGSSTISFGTSGSPAAFFAAATSGTQTLGRTQVTLIGSALLGADVDTVVVAVIAGTPSAGTLDVEVEFTVDNDS